MPLVSVVIPTYNRSDTILRALRSVSNQTFQDFELIVVDDGSNDNTVELIKDFDPRLKIIMQKNQGVSIARNNGIKASRGKYIALLDSDDEWDPIYLEACVMFLECHPQENVVHTEFIERIDERIIELQPYLDIQSKFVPLARKVGSQMLDLPPDETDRYLRIYKEKIPIGDWGKSFLQKMKNPIQYYYSGNVFEHWRWGYLMTVWSTVMTRKAFDQIGGFLTRFNCAEDYSFLANLCKNNRVNFLPFPGAIKNELPPNGKLLKEEHLASGKNVFQYDKIFLLQFENVFLKNNPNNVELQKIKAHLQVFISEEALGMGQKSTAIEYAEAALESDPNLFKAKVIIYLLKFVKDVDIANTIYLILGKLRYRIRKIVRPRY